MSGVIDESGQQWEHCNGCGKFVRIENLGYLKTTPADLCVSCAAFLLEGEFVKFEDIDPAPSWVPTEVL